MLKAQRSNLIATIGLISNPEEPHVLAIGNALKAMGHGTLFIDSTMQGKFSYLDGAWTYDRKALEEIKVFFFRNVLSPLPPAKFEGGEYKLYEDWFAQYMNNREVFGIELSWLFALVDRGKIVVNPPAAAGVGVIKPHQLYLLKKANFPLPRTLITHDPKEAIDFIRAVGRVIYKPAMGGAYAEMIDSKSVGRLRDIRSQYVIFQEYIEGADIRVTATCDEILSVAELESHTVDFRATPGYLEEQTKVTATNLPQEISQRCMEGIRKLGLYYSGIDLKRTKEGKYVFLEFNFHPAFLWIEKRLNHPIATGLAKFLIKLHEVG